AGGMMRVTRLSVVRLSARSSACRSVRPCESGTTRARRAGPGRARLLNVEAQSCVTLPERLLDGLWCLGAGEEEAEILPALGERDHFLARVHRDGDFLDALDRGGVVGAVDRREPPRPRDRHHHDAGGARLRGAALL